MAYPFALNPGALNVQTGLNVQGGLNVQPNAQPPGSFYPTTWPFSQPTGPTPVFGGLFSPQNLNVQSGLNVQNLPGIQGYPSAVYPTTWPFSQPSQVSPYDLNDPRLAGLSSSLHIHQPSQEELGLGITNNSVTPGLIGGGIWGSPGGLSPSIWGSPGGLGSSPTVATTTKTTNAKTTPAKTTAKPVAAPAYTWTDIHSPLPASVAAPGYVSPGGFVSPAHGYVSPYSQGALNAEAAGFKNVNKTYDAYIKSVDALRKKVASLPDLEPKAHARAVQDIGIMVTNIQNQQKMLMAQGQYNARAISGAGAAAVNLEKGIGDIVGRDVAGMAATTRLLGQGVGGALTGQAASDLARIAGATPGGQLSSQLVGGIPTATFPTATGNAVSQIQGEIPGQGLANQVRPAADMSARLAQLIQGGAQVAGQGAIAAGNQAANNLEPQITAAQNQLPTLTNQYLDTLTTQRQNEINNQLQFLVQTGQISVQKAQALSTQINTAVEQGAANIQGRTTYETGQAAAANTYNVGQAASTNAFNMGVYGSQVNRANTIAQIQGADVRANAQGRIAAWSANNAALKAAATVRAAQIRAAGKTKSDANKLGQSITDDIDTMMLGKWTDPSYASDGTPRAAQVIDSPLSPQAAQHKLYKRYPTLSNTPRGRALLDGWLADSYGPMRKITVPIVDENGNPTGDVKPVVVGWPPSGNFDLGIASQIVAFPIDKSTGELITTDVGQ